MMAMTSSSSSAGSGSRYSGRITLNSSGWGYALRSASNMGGAVSRARKVRARRPGVPGAGAPRSPLLVNSPHHGFGPCTAAAPKGRAPLASDPALPLTSTCRLRPRSPTATHPPSPSPPIMVATFLFDPIRAGSDDFDDYDEDFDSDFDDLDEDLEEDLGEDLEEDLDDLDEDFDDLDGEGGEDLDEDLEDLDFEDEDF